VDMGALGGAGAKPEKCPISEPHLLAYSKRQAIARKEGSPSSPLVRGLSFGVGAAPRVWSSRDKPRLRLPNLSTSMSSTHISRHWLYLATINAYLAQLHPHSKRKF
jgi:hypothetical protein